jgi:hypothetical protein
MYTEKLLYFHETRLNWPISELFNNVEKSPFVDTVKVRLLSPFTRAIESVNDKNVAIGKIRGLVSNLQYFPKREIRRVVIDRALYKFRDFILGPQHTTIRSIESLPTELGGLGIAVHDGYLQKLPPIWNRALRTITMGGPPGFRAQWALNSVFRNDVPRGIKTHEFLKLWVEVIVENLHTFPAASLMDIMHQIDPERKLSFKVKLQRIKKLGFISLQDLPREVEKSFILRRIAEGIEVPRGYRTESIKSRVAKAWEALDNIKGLHPKDTPLSARELKACIMTSKKSIMVGLNEPTVFMTAKLDETGEPGDTEFTYGAVKDVLRYGLPSMTVSIKHLKQV